MKFTLASLALAAFLPSALGHGWIGSVTVDDGQSFKGPIPPDGEGPQPGQTPIRNIATKGPSNTGNRACGGDDSTAAPANTVMEVKPGAVLTYSWTDGGSPWLHALGPISLYIASCGDSTCDKFSTSDAQNAEWFKVAQLGFNGPQTWFQGVIQQGNPLKFQLPSSLPAGDYLLRTEIIALHTSPAEIYPQCTQIRFSSGPTAKAIASPSNGVNINNAYSPSDPGFDLFSPNSGVDASNYVFPGPPLSNIAAGNEVQLNNGGTGSSGGSADTSGSSSGSGASSGSDSSGSSAGSGVNNGGTSGSQTGSAAAPAKTRTCKLRPRATPGATLLSRHRRSRARRAAVGGLEALSH